MIDRIQGLLVEKQPPSLVINTGNIGYELKCPMSVFYSITELNQPIELFTHFMVREDAQLLYGFNTKTEREAFRTILKINGIGAKIALAILSAMDINSLIRCIKQKNNTLLVKVPGIGKKTAERLLIELQSKLDGLSEQGLDIFDTTPTEVTSEIMQTEAEQALVSLGYNSKDAKIMLSVIDITRCQSTEALIKLALKNTL